MGLKLLIISLAITISAAKDGPMVDTNYGRIQGSINQTPKGRDFYTFHNIPYAKSPTGKLRFKDPEKPVSWEGVRNGIEEHNICIQPPLIPESFNVETGLIGHEDCLYLSVYTPQIDSNLLPVMFYIHGGGFLFGAGNLYVGNDLVHENVVLVSINYRLGILGFLSTEDHVISGNLGFKDQIMALKWVQENIAQFGGDPSRVTIFGQSAGGASVHFHVLSPYSKGLFSNAIVQSGTALCPWATSQDKRGIALQVGAAVGCYTIPQTGKQQSIRLLQCLQQVDQYKLAMTYDKFTNWGLLPLNFGPHVDGQYIPAEPELILMSGKYNQVDIMIGVTADDGGFFTQMMFGSENLLEKHQEQFEFYASVSLSLHSESDAAELSRKIYNHYLNKNTVDIGDVEELTKMFTDCHFKVCTDIVAEMHSGKVYQYNFDYRGKQTLLPTNAEFGDHWVSHVADIAYLFPINETKFLKKTKLDEGNNKMKDIMIKLWTNFAKYGNPTPDESLGFKWTPFSKQSPKQIVLQLQPVMQEHHRSKDMEFWSSLQMRQNQRLYELNAEDESQKYEL